MPYRSEDVAYAAGLYEGEGTAVIQRHYWSQGVKRVRKTPQIGIQMRMVDREPLDKLQAILGGRITGPALNRNNDNAKPTYQWRLDGYAGTIAAVAAMWKHLSYRRREQLAAVILEVNHSV